MNPSKNYLKRREEGRKEVKKDKYRWCEFN
jgi:hypothetical protein